jgi:tetratricopeptide (TPR) repeat protein
MTNKANLSSVQKVAALLSLLFLVVILVSFVVYRIDHPSLTRHEQVAADPMSDMTSLMERLQENPEDKQALFMLGQRFMQMQAWDKALEFWNRLQKLESENKSVLTQKGFCLFQKDKYEQAAGIFKEILRMDAEDYRAHYNLGMLYKYYLEKPDLARTHLQKVLEFLPAEEGDLRENVKKELAGDGEEE